MRIVLLGPPGSGKGTQAQRMEKRYGVPQISTGDIFRKAVAAKSELGAKVATYLDAGALVPDDLTMSLVRERLAQEDAERGFILDGFPRTVPQAVGVEEILREHGWELDAVINISIPTDVLVSRLTMRRVCPSCKTIYHMVDHPPGPNGLCTVCGTPVDVRPDDNVETIKKRMAVYSAQTAAVVDYYRKKSALIDVDGGAERDKVFDSIQKALEEKRRSRERRQ
ncbi:MAG: adenylate kinase [Candidatus Eisenbacteria bacterium]|nr:adenylate kinase [Candidatus Eisenbacteria bacterium]